MKRSIERWKNGRRASANGRSLARQSASNAVEEMRMAAKFQPGDTVRIRVGSPPGHFRTPAYVQGKTGVVEALHGAFPNPESLAHGGDGLPMQFLSLVRFEHSQHRPYSPSTRQDTLLFHIYEHWLPPA